MVNDIIWKIYIGAKAISIYIYIYIDIYIDYLNIENIYLYIK